MRKAAARVLASFTEQESQASMDIPERPKPESSDAVIQWHEDERTPSTLEDPTELEAVIRTVLTSELGQLEDPMMLTHRAVQRKVEASAGMAEGALSVRAEEFNKLVDTIMAEAMASATAVLDSNGEATPAVAMEGGVGDDVPTAIPTAVPINDPVAEAEAAAARAAAQAAAQAAAAGTAVRLPDDDEIRSAVRRGDVPSVESLLAASSPVQPPLAGDGPLGEYNIGCGAIADADGSGAAKSGARVAESARTLHRFAALSSAADVRRWARASSEDELLDVVRAVRLLHSSWLAADASLINMHVQLAVLKQGQMAAGVRGEADLRMAEEEKSEVIKRLGESEKRLRESETRNAEKQEEIGSLTTALQQTILERKSAAETQHRGRNSSRK
jgi:hypothetical protein